MEARAVTGCARDESDELLRLTHTYSNHPLKKRAWRLQCPPAMRSRDFSFNQPMQMVATGDMHAAKLT